MKPYSPEFYRLHKDNSISSARVIVPLVMDLLQPRSVVDVGCGLETWLAVFREHGVRDVYGLDGDHIDHHALLVPPDRFEAIDLCRPRPLNRSFDLVLSMEVGEHLPADAAANFIGFLTGLGPAVLFSAAIPYQGGTAHVNEQWQDYWARHFARHGFVPIDCIRASVWNNHEVQAFYAQNMLLYVRQNFLAAHPRLRAEHSRQVPLALSLVHPRTFLAVADPARLSFRQGLRFFCAVIAARIKARMRLDGKAQGAQR